MSKLFKKSKNIIIAMIASMIMVTASPAVVFAAEDTTKPVVTEQQSAGEIQGGSELKFTITDDTKLAYVFYAWNRRIDGTAKTIVTVEGAPAKYEFSIKAPTEPGLYEFSIAAQDYSGNISYWKNIPYVVVEKLSGVQDTEGPVFIFNAPGEYPYNNSTIEQERPMTIRIQDNSGIYYVAYKWTREYDPSDYATGATTVYNTNVLQIKAPKEPGVWYLQMYARDGANNISEGYYTKLTIKDKIAPTLTLNGEAEVDVPLNGKYTDPGATFNDNYDAQKVVYANETIDTSKVGKQTLTYTATDNAGNNSNTVTRIVTVVGTEKTYILTPPSKTEYNVNDTIDLTGASIKVIDERGNISYVTPTEDMFEKFSTKTLNTNQIFFTYNGTRVIYEYNVNDYIEDIIITPPTKVRYQYQEELNIEGGYVKKVMASGVNTIAEKITLDMLVSEYNKEKLGQQIIVVSYAGMQKSFTVTVSDLEKPVISINGENPQIIKKGQAYIELGATVTDNYNKNLIPNIDAAQVNINNVGIYDVIYNAVDSSGNIANTVIRKVHVVDYKQLQNSLKNIEMLVSTDYTIDTWNALENVVNESNNMINKNQSIQTEIDNQVEKVDNIINSLQAIKVDQTNLDKYISSFIGTDYMNWNDIETLINEARKITLQSKFDEKLNEIKTIKLVAKQIDNTKLNQIEEMLAKLDSKDYTETSWNAIQEKIQNAKKQTLQSKFDNVINEIDLNALIKLPKISNIIVATSNNNSNYAKVGDSITITFETNVELDKEKSISKINGKQVDLQKINEKQYKFNYTFTLGDVEGFISYAIEPKGILENIGNKVEVTSAICFDKTAPNITFAEGISDVDVNINDIYEIKESDIVVSDNNTQRENISIKIDKESLKLNKLGEYIISYSAIDEAGNKSEVITRAIHVKDYVSDIEIVPPAKINYVYKEELDLSGSTVKMIMASGTEVKEEAITLDMVTGYNSEIIGEQIITVNYAGKTKQFVINVDRAQYNLSGVKFENKTVIYNGNNQEILISGTLPEGVTVSYEGNGKVNAGVYTVVAKFAVDETKYYPIANISATLVIEKATYDMSKITLEGKTVTYNGN